MISKKLKQYLKSIDGVSHITLNPKGPGVIRIHLIPPQKIKLGVSWIVIINGQDILPMTAGWAILLREFIQHAYEFEGKEIDDFTYQTLIKETIESVSELFPKSNKEILLSDLKDILDTFNNIAIGKEPPIEIGYITLKEYAKYMAAPHRMDLMISSMEKDGIWSCNQRCVHCYASTQKEAIVNEISTEQWKTIIDKCQKAMISQITFTGGEPTLREDLVELVEYSKWFVTRLNTNGIKLSKTLCSSLYEASLDSVQVTFYSAKKEVHNLLVGSDHFDDTVEGIKNAIEANLNVSINTPLCELNSDYIETIKFAEQLGVRYFTCSGLIMTGNAANTNSLNTHLSKEKMYEILKAASEYCKDHGLELSFTSPGWVDEAKLRELRLLAPTCGACLSNMAIAPNGDVIPCQSWLSEEPLGNLLTDSFTKMWENERCKQIREKSANSDNICQLAIKKVEER